MTPQQQIDHIDEQIDASRGALLRRLGFNPGSAADWQRAWDRSPDLHNRELALYRQRGVAQLERDKLTHKEWQAEQRRQRRRAA